MSDWTSMLHSLAGAILGAGATLTGQLIFARNSRASTRDAALIDHQKWARDLASQAHDGFIVEFERLTPFYAPLDQPMAPDWLTGVHLKLQRMRLVCSTESYHLAHRAMQALERYRTTPGVPWEPAQTAFDTYLAAARGDLGLVQQEPDPTLSKRILEHAHLTQHIHARHPENNAGQGVIYVDTPADGVVEVPEPVEPPAASELAGSGPPESAPSESGPIPIAISEPIPIIPAPMPYSDNPDQFIAVLAPHPLGPAPPKAKVTYEYPIPNSPVIANK